jgi:hypothetical protein
MREHLGFIGTAILVLKDDHGYRNIAIMPE